MRRWLLPLLLPACDPGGVALPGEVEVDFPDDVELRVATAAGTTDAPPPPHGARWTVLTGRGRDAVPSPDGTRLAWTRDRPAVLDVATGAVLQELPEGDGCHHPVWSGDGDRIAAWCTLREASQSWVQGRLVVWDPAAQTVVEDLFFVGFAENIRVIVDQPVAHIGRIRHVAGKEILGEVNFGVGQQDAKFRPG